LYLFAAVSCSAIKCSGDNFQADKKAPKEADQFSRAGYAIYKRLAIAAKGNVLDHAVFDVVASERCRKVWHFGGIKE
jgi:hypothetical protein